MYQSVEIQNQLFAEIFLVKFWFKQMLINIISDQTLHQEVFALWYYCCFICCWYRFLSYIQVLFWLSNANFKFPMFSFSWLHRPIKDCLILYRKMKYVRLLKINESSFWHVSYSKFGFFWKKVAIFRKNLKIDNFLYGIKTKQDKRKNSNIVEKIVLKFFRWIGLKSNKILPRENHRGWIGIFLIAKSNSYSD